MVQATELTDDRLILAALGSLPGIGSVTISEALTDFVSTTTSALGSTLISNINDTLSRIDSAKSTNKFYTQVYDLYLQSYGANGLKQT